LDNSFKWARSLDERVAGQGIGLSVVRELVELNGGVIDIDKSALGGARVEVKIAPV
jgi:signal transduction histidine kinase